MKVYKKNVRTITIDQEEYCYVVKESVEAIVLRVYSTNFKSSYFDVVCHWFDYYDDNFYKPITVELAIRYALKMGWNPNMHNSKDIFSYIDEIVKE